MVDLCVGVGVLLGFRRLIQGLRKQLGTYRITDLSALRGGRRLGEL